MLKDKNLIELIFAKVLCENGDIVIPKTVCGCSAGYFFDSDRLSISYEKMIEKLQNLNGKYILKATVGTSSGRDVIVLDLPNEKLGTILSGFGNDYIIQEKIEQHASCAILHPQSVNTIRVMSYRTEDQIKTTSCVMRIGISGKYVDNGHAGGLYIKVMQDGKLSKFACRGNQGMLKQHPDSAIVFENHQLAELPKIVNAAKKLHACLPNIGIVNWDFAMNNESKPVLIEANMLCGSMWLFQNTGGGYLDMTQSI